MSTRTPLAPPPTRAGRVDADTWVKRFGLTERFAHWWTVLMVSAALLTGIAMGDEVESGPLLTMHVGAVVAIGAGLLTVLVLGDTRALLRAVFKLFTFDRRDATWVRDHVLHPFSHRQGAYGMFNPAQKVLAWALTAAVAAVISTGVQTVGAGGEDAAGPHAAAVVVAMVLVVAHIFMAVVNPVTRPALAGMVLGRVRRSWAARHHGGWLDDVDRQRTPR